MKPLPKVALLVLLIFAALPVASMFAATSGAVFTETRSPGGSTGSQQQTYTFPSAVPNVSSISVGTGGTRTFQNGSYADVTFTLYNGATSLRSVSGRIGVTSDGVFSDTVEQTVAIINNPTVTSIKVIVNYSNQSDTVSRFTPTATLTYTAPSNTETSKFVTNSLKFTPTSDTSGTLSWDGISSQYFKTWRVYEASTIKASPVTNSYSFSGLTPGKTYTWKVNSVDTFDKEFTTTGATVSYTVPIPDTTPPAIPVNLKTQPTSYTVLLTWDKVADADLAGYNVYVDNVKVNASTITTESYQATGFQPDTAHSFRVSAVDKSGNVSGLSASVNARTVAIVLPPNAPTGVKVINANGSATVTWDVTPNAKSYEVYVNGTLAAPVTGTTVKLPLKNGVDSIITVKALNDAGTSPASAAVTAKPAAEYVPDISLGYKLKDVSTGVSNWFGSYWLILAFSIAIPLSFYVANRIKGLFPNA